MYPGPYVRADSSADHHYTALKGDREATVCVIGGGVTGLSLALHLAQQGVDTVVLEAAQLGSGASGRSGGQVNSGAWYDPRTIEERLGPECAEKFIRCVYGAPTYLFNLVRALRIDCDANQSGTIRAAHENGAAAYLERLAEDYERRSIPIARVSSEQLAEKTGYAGYKIGLFDPSAGSINPLSYILGLARSAADLGATIHCYTPVVALESAPRGFLIKAQHGVMRARQAVVCTDAHSSLGTKAVRDNLLILHSALIASEPLGSIPFPRIVPTYETGTFPHYYRQDAAGRLIFGGITARSGISRVSQLRSYIRTIEKRWPWMRAASWEAAWCGALGMTQDRFPHVYETQPGLVFCLGYNGRGMGLGTVMGSELADYLRSGVSADLSVPFERPVRPKLIDRCRHGFMLRALHARELAGRLM
jgi:glycine/D-amino acid oxidase-like deaminating enzyme